LAVHSARTAQKAAGNDRLPVVDLAMQWNANGTDATYHDSSDALFSDTLYDWLLSLKIEMPLGNRERDARYRQRTLELAQAKATLRKTREDVILQVNEAIREVATSFREIELSAAATRSARESLDAIIQRMEKRGDYSPTFLDLRLNAEAQWIQARRDELNAITNYNVAIASYLRVTGTILQHNSIRLRPARAE
jgi:outer membrane protein TolC